MENILSKDFFNIKTNNIKPRSGKILISEPFNQDSHFKRSVVLLAEYSKEGAIGFVLNNKIEQIYTKKKCSK